VTRPRALNFHVADQRAVSEALARREPAEKVVVAVPARILTVLGVVHAAPAADQ
jgi:hypothetical protein